MFRPTRVEIQLTHLQHNLRLLKAWNGPADFFCPMVKANAYGHGALIVARAIEQAGVANALGVALVEEGVQLRQAGIRMPILTFSPLSPSVTATLLRHQLTPVVGCFTDLESLLNVTPDVPLAIHLKFNTGMNRIGFDLSDLDRLKQGLRENPQLQVNGVCTHLSHGSEIDQIDGPSQRQLQTFRRMSEGIPGLRHAHKSASLATLARLGRIKEPGLGARPGISLYGLHHENRLIGPGLKPVLRWVSHLVRVHLVEKGETVSYGGSWAAMRRSVIGILPVGYGDGYRRSLSNRGEMLFRNQRVPVVGSVCMDYTLIDLTDCCRDRDAQPGEEVVLLGRQGGGEISAADLADKAGTIAYEIVTGITDRVTRESYDSGLEGQSAKS